jgi:hypothetical protein
MENNMQKTPNTKTTATEAQLVELTDVELDHVSGGAPPHQGSGKNEGGHVVDKFAGNPHDRPGAN